MISRRRILGLLGLSPVAAPMVAQSAMAPTLRTGGRFAGLPAGWTWRDLCHGHEISEVGSLNLTDADFMPRHWMDQGGTLYSRDGKSWRTVHGRSEGGPILPGRHPVDKNDQRETHTPLADCRLTIRPHNAAMSCARTAREVKS